MVKSTTQLCGSRAFGKMGHVTNQLSFGIAPHEQNMFTKAGVYISNAIRRFRGKILISGPQFVIGYYLYKYGTSRNLEVSRKNPEDFANDA